MKKKITMDEALSISMQGPNGPTTIRGYLAELLLTLWEEGEGFSGKRPFGDSGWQFDLYIPLIQAGLVQGRVDEDGYIDEVDQDAAYDLVKRLIKHAIAGGRRR